MGIFNSKSSLLLIVFFMAVFVSVGPVNGLNSSVKDDNPGLVTGAPPDSGIKCTACSSCDNPCGQHPPPPPPSPPPPPKSPSKQYCPPPPPAPYMYVTGPPGNLYPLDPFFSGARRSLGVGLTGLVGFGLVVVLGLWRF